MLERMTAQEFLQWEAYFSIEPLPENRADLRHAQLMNILIQTASQGKSKPKLADLLPDWWGEGRQQSKEQMEQNLTWGLAASKAARKAQKGK